MVTTLAQAIDQLRLTDEVTTRQARKASGTYAQGFNDALDEVLGLVLHAPRLAEDPDVLVEILEYLDNQQDVNDGSHGEPVANRAMTLHMRLRDALGLS